MAENTRGQDRNDSRKNKNYPTSEREKNSEGTNRQISTNRDLTDMGPGRSVGRGTSRSSGMAAKRDISSSEYDGQLSDE